MNKNYKYWILGVLVSLIGWLWLGCAQTPLEKTKKAEQLVSQTEEHLQENDHQQEAVGMVYATHLALDQADESKPVELARGFNDRAQTILGLPKPEEASQLRQLVKDLLSQLEQERRRGEKNMEAFDKKLHQLAKEKNRIQTQLVLARKKLGHVQQENVLLAEKERQRQAQWWNPFSDLVHSLKKFLIWGIIVLGLVLLLPVLSAIFPILLPVTGAIGSLFGSFFGWLVKIIPGAISGAGLIGKKVFETVDETKDRLVEAIEQWQQEQKLEGKTDYKNLGQYLASILDLEHKNEVSSTKQKIASATL